MTKLRHRKPRSKSRSIRAGRRKRANRGGLNLFKWKDKTSTTDAGWKEGDNFLLLLDKGSPKANWKQNSGRLREAMGEGKPIYDSYREPNGELIPAKGFLAAERNLLQSRGWKYNPETGAWHPPTVEVQGAAISGAKSSGTSSSAKPHLDAAEIEPGVVAKETYAGSDGTHEIKVLKSGSIVRCSHCEEIAITFKDELTKYPHLQRQLDKIRLEPKEVQAKMAGKLAKEIGVYRAKRQGILESQPDFAAEVPYVAKHKEVLDPAIVNVYRGGPDFKLSLKDYTPDPESGLVVPERGLSLNTDPLDYFVVKMGGPHKIRSIPDELQIVQNRQPGTHVEIYPKAPMTTEQFQELLNQIKVEKY